VVCADWGHNTISGGYKNYAAGNYNSIAGGENNQLLGCYGFAVGDGNTVCANTSATVGAGNTILSSGGCGFASGCGNTIDSSYSGALGRGNCTCHYYSFAIGCGITTVCNDTTHVNCLNLDSIACVDNATGQLLPTGTVYYDTDCGTLNISL